MSLIELDLTWLRNCIIPKIARTAVAGNPDTNPPVSAITATTATRASFQINQNKFHVSAVTLSINYNIKCFEKINQGFKKTIS